MFSCPPITMYDTLEKLSSPDLSIIPVDLVYTEGHGLSCGGEPSSVAEYGLASRARRGHGGEVAETLVGEQLIALLVVLNDVFIRASTHACGSGS